jgi:hypothetical protein
MTQANEPPNAQNDTGHQEQALSAPISNRPAISDRWFGLVIAGVALLMLLALLYAAWLYFDWEGRWFDW